MAVKHLTDTYKFPGFEPYKRTKGVFGQPDVRIVSLKRKEKKRYVEHVGLSVVASTITGHDFSGIFHVAIRECSLKSKYGVYFAPTVRK